MDFPISKAASNEIKSKKEDSLETAEAVDPDYVSEIPGNFQTQACLNLHQQDAKEHAIHKIQNIIRHQFALEMHLKEKEIETIDQTIRQTKATLDRLRACVLARYYGMSSGYREDDFSTSESLSLWGKPRRSRREGVKYLQKQLSSRKAQKTTRGIQVSNTGLPVNPSRVGLGKLEIRSFQTSELSSVSGLQVFQELSSELTLNPVSCVTLPCTNSASISNQVLDKTVNQLVSGVKLKRDSPVLCSAVSSSTSSVTQSVMVGTEKESEVLRINASRVESASVVSQSQLSAVPGIPRSQSSAGPDISRSQLCAGPGIPRSQLSAGQDVSLGSQLSAGQDISRSQINAGQDISRSQSSGTSSLKGTQVNACVTQLSVSSNLNKIQEHILEENALQSNTSGSGSRFYIKKKIIIGNTSKYIAAEKREENDKSTHKWMVYVRGPPEDPHIDTYIQKVWFFLHPSYRPNDIVEVNKPPFHLTRRGWGEFPIRVQLHFVGSRNKRVDIIHELRLDKTYTGLQTLGAETVVDLEIDRKTFEDLGIPVPMETTQEKLPGNFMSTYAINNASNTENNNTTYPDVSRLKMEYNCASSSDVNKGFKKLKLDTPLSSGMSTPCGTQASSRCTSPVLSPRTAGIEEGVEELLHGLAEEFPMIQSTKDVVNTPFSARTAEEFLQWNVGKRRASEWQRAVRIRAKLRTSRDSTRVTTKDIVIWCRRFGHTPQYDLLTDPQVEYCKICGRITRQGEASDSRSVCPGQPCLELSNVTLSSLSSVSETLTQLEEKERYLSELSKKKTTEEEEIEIDILGVQKPESHTSLPTNKRPSLLSLPVTPAQQWVKDVCNDIGMRIRPVVMDGVEVHATESALFAATLQFMKDLLRQSLALSTGTDDSLAPKLLVPRHIYDAVGSLPQCDFLRNSYFGSTESDQ